MTYMIPLPDQVHIQGSMSGHQPAYFYYHLKPGVSSSSLLFKIQNLSILVFLDQCKKHVIMNQRYVDYADYNIWANNRFIKSLLSQNEDLLSKELVSSFSTIFETILHIWYGEMGWLSRLRGNGWEVSKVEDFSGDFPELADAWMSTSQNFRDFVQHSNLEKKISFKHEGETFSIPGREMAQTVFNHGSYHRGQIITMMRQLEITELPKTDYIEWVRERTRIDV